MAFPSLKCIKCSEEGGIMLHLDDCTTFRCRECEADFTAEDVREHVSAWQGVLGWVETAPAAVAGKVA